MSVNIVWLHVYLDVMIENEFQTLVCYNLLSAVMQFSVVKYYNKFSLYMASFKYSVLLFYFASFLKNIIWVGLLER